MKRDTTSFDPAEYKTTLDQQIAGVMPETWLGHARVALSDKDLSDEQEAKVLEHTENIAEREGLPAERVALKVVEKLGY